VTASCLRRSSRAPGWTARISMRCR
jgi:hypothetical protein